MVYLPKPFVLAAEVVTALKPVVPFASVTERVAVAVVVELFSVTVPITVPVITAAVLVLVTVTLKAWVVFKLPSLALTVKLSLPPPTALTNDASGTNTYAPLMLLTYSVPYFPVL